MFWGIEHFAISEAWLTKLNLKLSTAMLVKNIKISEPQIAKFCQRWRITELALFGSALQENFRSDSDIDVLVKFIPNHQWTLFDHVDMQDELEAIFGRKVDLVSKSAIERSRNYIRRKNILNSAQVIYAVS